MQVPLALERLEQPREIAPRRRELRLLDLDEVQADDGIDCDRARVGLLADDLAVDLALRRHVDDDVLRDVRRAAEPSAVGEAAVARVRLLGLASPASERRSCR